MRHPADHQQAREELRKVWVWFISMFLGFAGCAILSRERDWTLMLLITSPYLALLIPTLYLTAREWISSGRMQEQSSFTIPEAVLAAAQERFFVRSSDQVQADITGIRAPDSNERTGNDLASVAPDVSLENGTSYYAIALAVSAWIWLLAAIPFLTDAACRFIAAGVLALSWMILAYAWLWGLAAARFLLPSARARKWWLSAGLAGLLGLLLAFTDAGFVLRVKLSEQALETYAAAVPPGARTKLHSKRQVGLFLVDGTEEKDGAVVLYTASSFLDRHGIVYLHEGKIPPPDLRDVKHLFGKWYSFRWHF